MRIGITGSGPLAMLTTRQLLKDNHEVVIIEPDSERIETLSDELDCGFVQGDASRPKILKELSPENTEYLFCINEADDNSIITALIGRSLGFEHVITVIEDPEYLTICQELGLEDVQVPDFEVAKRLASMVEGRKSEDFSALLEDGLTLYRYQVKEGGETLVKELELPEQARVIAVHRDDKALIADPDTELREDDQVVILVAEEALDDLEEQLGKL